MPNWKKVITSGSNVHLNHITSSGNISSSGGTLSANAVEVQGNTALNIVGGKVTFGQHIGDLQIGKNTSQTTLTVAAHITASGNISSSGRLQAIALDVVGGGSSTRQTAVQYHSPSNTITFGDTDLPTKVQGTTLTLTPNITASGNISASNTSFFSGQDAIFTRELRVGGAPSVNEPGVVVSGQISSSGFISTKSHITASGNISSSGNLSVTGDLNLDGKSHFEGNITASGDISSSGDIIGGDLKLTAGSIQLASDADNKIEIDGSGHKYNAKAGHTMHYNEQQENVTIKMDSSAGNNLFSKGNAQLIGMGGNEDPKATLDITGNLQASSHITASGTISASGGGHVFGGSGAGSLDVQGTITSSGDISASGANFIGHDIELYGGQVSLKNSGSQSNIRFYCESNNAHFVKLQAPAHADFGGNVTITLPPTTDTLVGKTTTDTLTNKTLTSPDINTPDIDGGTIDNTIIGGTTKTAGSFTILTGVNITGSGAISGSGTGSFGALKVNGTDYLGNPTSYLTELDESTDATDDKIILWDQNASAWKYMTLDNLQDSIDTTGGGGGGGISFDGSAANGVLTFKDSDEATVESNLTFDGTTLITAGNLSASGNFQVEQTASIQFNNFDTGSNPRGDTYGTVGNAMGDIVKFGIVDTGTMVEGKVYYLNTSGQWVLANATDNTAGADELLAIALGDNPAVHGMLLRGVVRISNAPAASNVRGRAVYISTTGGLATTTAPSSNNNIVRVMGYLLDNTKKQIWFNPSSVWVKVTA